MSDVVGVPWDFFHLGLLLVMIMVLITGIVLCVAVAGVCCFHWIDSNQNLPSTDIPLDDKTRRKNRRIESWRLENMSNEELARRESPPTYETLFPTTPTYLNLWNTITPPQPHPQSNSLPPPEELNKSPQFVLYV